MKIQATDLNQWLAERPLTRLSSRKYSSCQQRRWEYRICHCSCGYKINITHVVDADGDYCEVTDSGDIPLDHHDVDENPDNVVISKQVLNAVDKLLEHNKFAKNYGLKRLIGNLWRQGIQEAEIPSQKQLQNHLYYFRRTKFKYSNEITPLEEKLCKHIFVDGEGEPLDKPFVYHYDTDEDDWLILGDGSDE